MHQVARLADAALPAGGGNFRAGALTEALGVQAQGWTGWKAVGVAAMGRALQRDIGAVTAAILEVLAVSLQGTLKILALDGPSRAVTALSTAAGDPGLTFWDESTLGIFAATLISEYTLVIMQHVARLTDAALPAGGESVGAGSLTVDIRIRAGGLTRRQAAGEVAVGWALQRDSGAVTVAVLDVLAVSL